jgi:glycosyltransferase involved in cell wall biosynthesis
MRILYANHSCVLRVNQERLHALARCPGLEVGLLVPSRWHDRDTNNRYAFEPPRAADFAVFVRDAFLVWHPALFAYRWRAVARVLDAFRPDLVHIEQEPYSIAGWQIARAARARGVRIVLTTYQNLDKRYPLPFRLMERATLAAADRLVAGTDEIRRLWERRAGRSDIAVIPLGYDPARFYPRASAPRRTTLGLRGFVIGYVGRLIAAKGLGTLLEAAARLSGDFTLLLDGRGPCRGELERVASGLGLASRLAFVHPTHDEVPESLSCMDALVLPSYTTPEWTEQFGRVLVEAMACGVPVVGSSSGAIPSVIGDAGLVFPERDAVALATCLERLMTEPGLREDLRRRGLERAPARFSWERVAGLMCEVYRKALA